MNNIDELFEKVTKGKYYKPFVIQDANTRDVHTETLEAEQAEIDRLFSSLNHIGYSAVTGPIDKPCQCQACSKEKGNQ